MYPACHTVTSVQFYQRGVFDQTDHAFSIWNYITWSWVSCYACVPMPGEWKTAFSLGTSKAIVQQWKTTSKTSTSTQNSQGDWQLPLCPDHPATSNAHLLLSCPQACLSTVDVLVPAVHGQFTPSQTSGGS